MRLDAIGLRTWLLAALAGAALVFWLLVLTGFGAGITPLPANSALAQSLPKVESPEVERIGLLQQYAEIGRRPLFSPDRKPQPFSLQEEKKQAPAQPFNYILTGVLLTPSLNMAIVQPSGGGDTLRLRVGAALEPMPAWRLVALKPRSAEFEGPGGKRVLELRSEPAAGQVVPAAVVPPVASNPEMPPQEITPAVDPATQVVTPEAQMETIRSRIQSRREQLRQDLLQQQPPETR